MTSFTGILGVVVLLALAWAISENRRKFPWRMVVVGTLLQGALALLLLRTPGVIQVFDAFAHLVNGVIEHADAGIAFVFGPRLMDPTGPWGMIFAVRVLPVIIFFASLMAVLYYIGVMQRVVAALAWLLRRTMGVTGAEALAMASNVFLGQTEAPLCIRPYLDRLTRAQWATVMIGGFATIAGSVLVAYVWMLAGTRAEDAPARVEFIKHLLTASVMAAPAAFVMARIIVPETQAPPEEGFRSAPEAYEASNIFDAAAYGASDGLRLSLNVGAMLIAFVGLLALVNWPLEALSGWAPVRGWLDARGVESLSLQTILGWALMPLAWLMGVESADASLVGSLLGQKIILTEFVAYSSLGEALHAEGGPRLSDRSAKIAAYALCGFANFASIAIQIGGLTALAPSRRKEIVSLSLRAMIGGALATNMTAAIAGLVIG